MCLLILKLTDKKKNNSFDHFSSLPYTGLNVRDLNTINVSSKVNNIVGSSSTTITRYIYIKNIDNPVKIFRETAV